MNLSDEGFDDLRADWDATSGARGSFWHMLKHAEIGGFDLAVLKGGISASLRDFFGKEKYRLTTVEERELVINLRDRMRLECLLPPLNSDERRDWKWHEITPSRIYRQEPFHYAHKTDIDQHREIVSYMASHYPEAIRYLKSVSSHNATLGYNGGTFDKYIIRGLWHYYYLQDAACAVLGETGEYNLDVIAIGHMAAKWVK